MADPAESENQNLLPVQAYFSVDGEFQTFIGQGQPFYATVDPDQSGLHITNSTIDSTTIGAITPSTGVFTNVSTTTGTISTAPTANTDIVNKAYVDAVAQGLAPKQAVKCATTADIVLLGLQTIDTYTTLAGDRVLVKNQATSSLNGIYIASVGAWTRSADMDVWSEVPGAYTVALNGSTNLDTGWVCTAADTGTINVTAMPWVQFAGAGTYFAGTGLTLAANTFSITDTGVTAATKGSASKTVTAAVNAQGQLTSLTDQDIAIAGTQITSGLVSPTVGGTGVNNGANTLTWNASYSLNQSVASGAAPTFTGTNFTGIPNAGLTNSAITVNGTSIALGASGTITAVNPNALTLGTGLSGTSYDGSAAVTAAIANTGVTANSYTYGSFTVNAQGQLTAASSNATTGTGSIVLAAAPTVSGEWSAFDSVSFNTSATPTSAVGKIYWDGGTTLNIGMTTHVTQKVGEDQFYYVKASSAITKGQLCYFTGVVGASSQITVAPAGAGITNADYFVGLAAESIALNGFGLIQSIGSLKGFDTSAFVDGDVLYYDSVSGGMTNVYPATGIIVVVAAVTNAASGGSGSVQVRVSKTQRITAGSGISVSQSVAGSTVSISAPVSIANGGTNTTTTPVAGAVAYGTGSAYAFTSTGTTGQVLTSNGSSTPTWTTPASAITISDDTTTNATRYPLFSSATTGEISTEYVSSTKYQFNPSTGVLTSTSFTGAGTGLTGTASSLSIGGNAATATSATTATNLAGGAAGSLPYQASSGSTTLLAAGSNGQILTLASGVPSWAAAPVTGITITDDTTTNATRYLTFTSATTGTITGEDVSSTKLQYKPSTGTTSSTNFTASGTVTGALVNATNGIVINSQTVAASYSIPSGSSAMSAGPITVASGQSVTVASGSRWVVL